MLESPITTEFRKADTSDLPMLDALETEKEQSTGYSQLEVATRAPGTCRLLRFRMSYERSTVLSFPASACRPCWPMSERNSTLAGLENTPTSVVFVRPEEALTGIRSVQAILGSAKGAVSICDPYVDGRSLDLLTDITEATSLRLLSMNGTKQTFVVKLPIDICQASLEAFNGYWAQANPL